MRILATFPGRYGDLLWALPSVRALSEAYGVPIDLQIAGEFSGLLDLLALQPYLATIYADASWSLTTKQAPPLPGPLYDRTFSLGYPRWPEKPLPFETEHTLRAWRDADGPIPAIDLGRPWIIPPPRRLDFFNRSAPAHCPLRPIAVGFSECHFELKYGLLQLMDQHSIDWNLHTCMGPGGRWMEEAGEGACNWLEAADCIVQAEVFLGDCSALHVLAVALGKPVVIVEPMEARWNPIFYPLGMDGPQVTVVKGLDGLPTFDARHCAETLEKVLEASHAS